MKLQHRIPPRGLLAYGHDIIMAGLSFILALELRIGGSGYILPLESYIQGALIFAAIGAVVFWQSGMYRGIWRYASLKDLVAITKGVSITVLVFLLVMFAWTRLDELPRSLPVINWFVLMALLGGPRFIYRMFKDKRLELKSELESGNRIPVLLAGAGDEAELFIRGLRQTGDSSYRVVGIVAQRRDRVGREIHGVPVLGVFDDIGAAINRLGRSGDRPHRLVITRDNLDGSMVSQLLDQATALGMSLSRMPRLTDFKAEGSSPVELRPVAVEDLLGRPQAALDAAEVERLIQGKCVMVTGAGGSIGAELVRQISHMAPRRLILVENSEFALYQIDQEMGEASPDLDRRAVIRDVRQMEGLTGLMIEERPDLVFHAAALKHVPLVEANPVEGFKTNALGTMNVAKACREAGVGLMVLISTDKAVNPTNVMGASKRMAEICCQALDLAAQPGTTRFVTVRFGNVLGSTGSVVPLFRKQLEKGGPLTVTHPDMTRYFMTIREAVELVLHASAFGAARDADGQICVLDMGQPVKIADLARQMIRLAGKEPETDIKIEFTGVRPGEKLFEEIFHGAEAPLPTDHPGVLIAAPRITGLAEVEAALDELTAACLAGDLESAARVMSALVPEYDGPLKPSEDAGTPHASGAAAASR